jgi:hypothetical protein
LLSARPMVTLPRSGTSMGGSGYWTMKKLGMV